MRRALPVYQRNPRSEFQILNLQAAQLLKDVHINSGGRCLHSLLRGEASRVSRGQARIPEKGPYLHTKATFV